MVVFPNAKINLGLHIVQKRNDGFHNIETVFYPVPWCDVLEIVAASNTRFQLSGTQLPISVEENICWKAWKLLQQNYSQHFKTAHIHLHKVLPAGAGLGGGSSNAAYMLMAINEKFQLHLSHEMLLQYATLLGSDCAFFIFNKPCLATGKGEILKPVTLSLQEYKILIVYPNISISTRQAFANVQPCIPSQPLSYVIQQPVEEWKHILKNDFEEVIFPLYPEIAFVKQQLYEAGAVYAAMSGSGSAVYGLFKNEVPKLSWSVGYESFSAVL